MPLRIRQERLILTLEKNLPLNINDSQPEITIVVSAATSERLPETGKH